jgi:exosortase
MRTPVSWLRNGWTVWHAVSAVSLTVLGIFTTLDAWQDIYRIAVKDEESSHIFLVPIVAAWLIWVRRRRLRHCQPQGHMIGPALVAAGWFFYSFGDARLIQSFWHGGAVLVAVGCLLTVLGRDLLWNFLPVFVMLVFLVPVPGRVRQQVAIPLGAATARVTETIFDLLGTPVQRSGNLLSINQMDVSIAEACNGLRMVFALTLVSFAFAFGTPLRGFARLLVLVASPISAIVCNVIRLVPTLWVYGNFSREKAAFFHDLSGWVMLPIAFMLLMGILRALRWALVPVTHYPLAYD